MRDFSLQKWRSSLCALRRAGYVFLSFEDYLTAEQLLEKFVILRHDIDRITAEALRIAHLERSLNVRAIYYFRTSDKQDMPAIMQAISGLCFEVGGHYEDVTASNGDIQEAYRRFVDNLNHCQQYAPIHTVCMHGNPWSRYDEKTLWQHYDFRESGIIGEPYLNTDFTDSLNHYTARIYYGIASQMTAVAQSVGAKVNTLPARMVAFDSFLYLVRAWLKKCLRRDSRLYHVSKRVFLLLARKKDNRR